MDLLACRIFFMWRFDETHPRINIQLNECFVLQNQDYFHALQCDDCEFGIVVVCQNCSSASYIIMVFLEVFTNSHKSFAFIALIPKQAAFVVELPNFT